MLAAISCCCSTRVWVTGASKSAISSRRTSPRNAHSSGTQTKGKTEACRMRCIVCRTKCNLLINNEYLMFLSARMGRPGCGHVTHDTWVSETLGPGIVMTLVNHCIALSRICFISLLWKWETENVNKHIIVAGQRGFHWDLLENNHGKLSLF